MLARMNVLILIVMVTTGSCSSLFEAPETKKFGGLKALQEIEESKFGRQLLDTIALQMKNETPLQDIAGLLGEIRADLVAQQKADDKLQQERELDCELSVADFEVRIQTAVDNIATAVQTIGSLRSQITMLKTLLANYETQMALLSERLETVQNDRAQDREDYARRTVRQEETVAALELILPKLRSLAPQAAASALLELSKIGKSNPIAAFITVASTIDVDKLNVVVDKMTELLASLQASLVEDAANEAQAETDHNTLVNDLQQTHKEVSQQHATATSNLNQAESKLASTERFLEEQRAEEQAAREGLAAKKEQCALWKVNYDNTKESRSAERAVVEKVQQILAERLASMSDYLRERVDHDF